jgi:hypothetical protein
MAYEAMFATNITRMLYLSLIVLNAIIMQVHYSLYNAYPMIQLLEIKFRTRVIVQKNKPSMQYIHYGG